MRNQDFFLHQYAPVTTHMAFFEMPISDFSKELYVRTEEINQMWQFPWEVKCQPVVGDFPKKLEALLPLTSVRSTKTLVSSTHSDWSVYIPNGARGGDIHTEPRYLTGKLKVRSISIVLVDDEINGQPGSVQFVVRDGRCEDVKTRSVAAHRESRWEFSEYGDRFPFEEVEKYSARRIKDRLTFEMVERYCANFGIFLFDPDFYSGEGYIIHNYPPKDAVFYPEYPNQISKK